MFVGYPRCLEYTYSFSLFWKILREDSSHAFDLWGRACISFLLFIYLSFHPGRNFCPAAIPPSPDVSYPESCPPPFHLLQMSHIRNSVRLTSHLLWMYHIRNSVRPTSHLLRMSRIRNPVRPTFHLSGYLTFGILSSRHSTFFGCLTSGILSTDVPPSPDTSHPEFLSGRHPTFSRCHFIRKFCPPTFHLLRMSHIGILSAVIPLYPDASHLEFCPADVSPSPDVSHSEFYPLPFHLFRMSHIRNFVRRCPPFSGCLTFGILSTAIPPSSDVSHPEFCPSTFHLLRIFHIWRLTPDGRGG